MTRKSEVKFTKVMEQENNQEPSPSPKEKPKGQILKEAREAQGVSLNTVHESTKIPMDVLRAIEEGYTIRTLSSFYLKGFIKLYAKYLNLDEHLVVDDTGKEPVIKPMKDLHEDDFNVEEWFSKVFDTERKQQLIILGGILLGLFLLFKLIVFATHKPATLKKKSPAAVEQTQSRQSAVVPASGASQVTAQAPATTQQSSAKPEKVFAGSADKLQKNVVLTVRAKEKSWLRVKVDSEVVFQSTLRAGAVETWMADEKIEIAGRNINQLEFELNGKLIGTLGRADRKAKQVIITKDGLTVTK